MAGHRPAPRSPRARQSKSLEHIDSSLASDGRGAWRALCAVFVAGCAIGASWPNTKIANPWAAWAQSACGWSYTLAWSLSFWPQVVMNHRRKDVTGLSLDFLALNLLGWVAYSTFNVAIYFVFECHARSRPSAAGALGAGPLGGLLGSPLGGGYSGGGGGAFLGAGPAAAEFAAAGFSPAPAAQFPAAAAAAAAGGANAGPPRLGTSDFCQYAVELNDVVFALHALAVTLITAAQCCLYPRGKQRVHGAVLAAAGGAAGAAVVYAAAISLDWAWLGPAAAARLDWLDWLYFLAYVKMGVTLTKYIPQALLNCRRRSTVGWSILNILLDATGGCLSLAQQLLTCHWTGNWTPVTANPVKLGLALTSLFMDGVFLVQHYWLYPAAGDAAGDAAAGDGGDSMREPLLGGGGGSAHAAVFIGEPLDSDPAGQEAA